MKAILVVDVPNDLKYEDLYFDGEIRYTSEFDRGYVFLKETGRCLLKSMPNYIPTPYLFRQMQIADGLQNSDGSVPVYSEDYMNGWNDCIDEILSVAKENEL